MCFERENYVDNCNKHAHWVVENKIHVLDACFEAIYLTFPMLTGLSLKLFAKKNSVSHADKCIKNILIYLFATQLERPV